MNIKITRKRLLIISIIFTVFLAGILFKYLYFTTPVTYITTDVGKRDIEEKVLANGTLNAFKTVEVGAQVSGQLKKLHVALGDRVKTGQFLAEIDPVIQQNDLKNAEAEVEKLQAQKKSKQALLKQYDAAYHRQVKMIAKDASSHADLENAQAKLDSTQADIVSLDAQIKQAEVSVDTAKANLSYTQITAPIDGIVTSITTEEGQTVVSTQTATTILTLSDLDTITVKAEISEADIMRVQPGQVVYFTTIGDLETKYYGKLRAIEPGPISDSDTSSTSNSSKSSSSSSTAIYYNGLFEVPNADHKLRISMTVQVSIVLKEAKQVLCIPISALGDKVKDGYTVRVLHNNTSKVRQIKTGITDNVYIQVLSGLQIGDKVILGDSTSAEKMTDANTSRPRMMRRI